MRDIEESSAGEVTANHSVGFRLGVRVKVHSVLRLNGPQFANHATFNIFFHLVRAGLEARPELVGVETSAAVRGALAQMDLNTHSFHEEHVLLSRQVDQRLGLRRVADERLFEQDVLPSRKGCVGVRIVVGRRRTNEDHINILTKLYSVGIQ